MLVHGLFYAPGYKVNNRNKKSTGSYKTEIIHL